MYIELPGNLDSGVWLDDQWWEEARVPGFAPEACHYRSTGGPEVHLVVLAHVRPRVRIRGLNKKRLVRILRGFRDGTELPAVVVTEIGAGAHHRYRLVDGLHRYWASEAVGFTHIRVRQDRRTGETDILD